MNLGDVDFKNGFDFSISWLVFGDNIVSLVTGPSNFLLTTPSFRLAQEEAA